MKQKQNRELMHMAEKSDLLVKQRSALKGKINNLLAMQGIELKREALVEEDCAGKGVSPACEWDGEVGAADIGRADPLVVGENSGVRRATGRRRPTTAWIRKPDEY